jgi:hypothetical protein
MEKSFLVISDIPATAALNPAIVVMIGIER